MEITQTDGVVLGSCTENPNFIEVLEVGVHLKNLGSRLKPYIGSDTKFRAFSGFLRIF
jgi:hypothetical protein